MNVDPEWAEFLASGSLRSRNVLLLRYSPLVTSLSTHMAKSLPPNVDKEDLYSYGIIGLIDAISKFDPGRGVKFETYATTRIRGSIIDELRSQDWTPRSIRSTSRSVSRATGELSGSLGRPPSEQEVALHLGVEPRVVREANTALTLHSLDELTDRSSEMRHETFERGLVDVGSNPEQSVDVSELVEVIAGAAHQLKPRSKTILVLYYIECYTLVEIGAVLGVTESRICQLQSQLLRELRGILAGAG